jgi:hypothetical protein
MSHVFAARFWNSPTGAISFGAIIIVISLFRLFRLAAGQPSIADDSDAAKGQVLLGLLIGAALLAYGISML